ncbi:MAG: (2Fe-2S)-binding protein [Pseudomonadota bacterium]
MYVCICQAITDGQIRKAIESGIDSVDKLRDTLGVASCCGSCMEDAQALVSEHRRCEPIRYNPALASS